MRQNQSTLKALVPVILLLTAAIPSVTAGAERVVLGELHTALW